jgi:hypothetical protein
LSNRRRETLTTVCWNLAERELQWVFFGMVVQANLSGAVRSHHRLARIAFQLAAQRGLGRSAIFLGPPPTVSRASEIYGGLKKFPIPFAVCLVREHDMMVS